jgi:cell wall-associated NlpC family hydrolase
MPVTLSRPLHTTLLSVVALLALLLGPLSLLAPAADAATADAEPTSTAKAAAATKKRSARVARIDRALNVAMRQRGDRYRYGAAGPDAFDCSGLVYFSTHRAGLRGVPRTSSQQARHMDRIKRKRMRPGDFVFFTGRSGVYHVGIYVGRRDGRRTIVHAPSTGSRVRTEAIWTDRWFPGSLR